VVLDLPRVVDAEAVRELDLVERVLEEALFAVRVPRPGQLMLVEDPEAHPGIVAEPAASLWGMLTPL
jgi:hypothetical protein